MERRLKKLNSVQYKEKHENNSLVFARTHSITAFYYVLRLVAKSPSS
jgi:hypothetical protein